MADRQDLVRLQLALAEALTHDDFARLQALASELPPELRAAVLGIDGDGFRLAALLIARLRFERLMRLSDPARAAFERDPAGFTAAFREFCREHRAPPGEPWRDARAFAAWWAEREG